MAQVRRRRIWVLVLVIALAALFCGFVWLHRYLNPSPGTGPTPVTGRLEIRDAILS